MLPVLLLDPDADHGAHDRLAGGHTPRLVALLSILEEGHTLNSQPQAAGVDGECAVT